MNIAKLKHAAGGMEKEIRGLLASFGSSQLTFEQYVELAQIAMQANNAGAIQEIKKLLAQFERSKLTFDEYIRLVRVVSNHHQRMAMDKAVAHGDSARLGVLVTNALRHHGVIGKGDVFFIEKPDVFVASLKHHGILGMRWGVRRYRGTDGRVVPGKYKSAAKAERLRREGGNNAPLQANQSQAQQSGKNPAQRQQATGVDTTPTTNPNHEPPGVITQRIADARAGRLQSQNLSTQQIQNIINRINVDKQLAELTKRERTRSQQLIDRALREIGDAGWKTYNKAVSKTMEKYVGELIGMDLASKKK